MTIVPAEQISSKREERWFAARLLFLLVAVIAAFVGLIMLRSNATSSKYPRVKLPDGSWLVARQVTVGKNHAIEIRYPLGVQFQRWQQSFKQPHMTSEDRTVVWLLRENDRGEQLDLDWLKRVEVDIGDPRPLTPKQYQRHTIRPSSSGGSGVGSDGFVDARPFGNAAPVEIDLMYFDVPLLRPRESKLIVKVFDGSETQIAALPIAYPAVLHESTEQWSPDPLPASRSDGNLTVTLNGLDVYEHPGANNALFIQPRLTFVHDGEPSQTWWSSDQYHDLLGNNGYSWGCELSTSESAWKLSLMLSQSPNGRFRPEETLKLPLRPLTAAQKITAISENHTVNGRTVSLHGLGGAGPLQFTLPGSTSSFKTGTYQPGARNYGMTTECNNGTCKVQFASGAPFIVTSENLSESGWNDQYIIRDQNGEVLEQQNSSGGTGGFTFRFFEPKSTSTSVEIEIIVQKYRHAEFLIAPPKPDEIKKRQ